MALLDVCGLQLQSHIPHCFDAEVSNLNITSNEQDLFLNADVLVSHILSDFDQIKNFCSIEITTNYEIP